MFRSSSISDVTISIPALDKLIEQIDLVKYRLIDDEPLIPYTLPIVPIIDFLEDDS